MLLWAHVAPEQTCPGCRVTGETPAVGDTAQTGLRLRCLLNPLNGQSGDHQRGQSCEDAGRGQAVGNVKTFLDRAAGAEEKGELPGEGGVR